MGDGKGLGVLLMVSSITAFMHHCYSVGIRYRGLVAARGAIQDIVSISCCMEGLRDVFRDMNICC